MSCAEESLIKFFFLVFFLSLLKEAEKGEKNRISVNTEYNRRNRNCFKKRWAQFELLLLKSFAQLLPKNSNFGHDSWYIQTAHSEVVSIIAVKTNCTKFFPKLEITFNESYHINLPSFNLLCCWLSWPTVWWEMNPYKHFIDFRFSVSYCFTNSIKHSFYK